MIAHELAHIKNRDTLIMTITATIAGAISMLAQFGMFFGGGPRQQQRRLGIDRHAGDGDPRADRRHAGADGDQPHARIRRRRPRRAHRRPADVARLGAGQDRATRRTRSRTRRPSAIRRPRICSSSTRCPASGMDNLFSTHPATENRIAALAAAGARDGRRRIRRAAAAAPGCRPPAGPGAAPRRGGPWG